jgi:predicted ribosomally synthesized peptide with SipW-like signal peptide
MPEHRASAPFPRLRRATKAIAAACGAFALAITIALAAAGGTYAYFSSTAQLNAGSVTAGTAALKINGSAAYTLTGLDTTNLTPGQSVVSAPLTITNDGDTSLLVTQGGATFSQHDEVAPYLTIKLGVVPNGTTTCTAGQGTSLSAAPQTVAKNQSFTGCVTVTLQSAAPYETVAGKSVTFTIPIDGNQVRP